MPMTPRVFGRTVQADVEFNATSCVTLPAPPSGRLIQLTIRSRSGLDGFYFDLFSRRRACPGGTPIDTADGADTIDDGGEVVYRIGNAYGGEGDPGITVTGVLSDQRGINWPYANMDQPSSQMRPCHAIYLELAPVSEGSGTTTFDVSYIIADGPG